MTAFAILAVFFTFALLMLLRKVPAILAVPAMALLVAAVARTPLPQILNTVVNEGAAQLTSSYLAVFFGAMLGQVMMQTGIAESFIKRAAEYGGDRPILIALLLSVATAALFLALTGLGAIIMVGSLVLPILTSVGVSRRLAASLFLMAYGVGFVINISLWQFYRDVLKIDLTSIRPFAFGLMAVNAVVAILFLVVQFRRESYRAFWAVRLDTEDETAVRRPITPLAFLTPILPILLTYFHCPIIPAFLAGSLFGVLVTRRCEAGKILSGAAIRGMEDAAPAIVLMIGIGMLLKTASLPEVKRPLEPIIALITPHSPITYVVFFTLLSPLVLYRGPLNPWGVGISVYALMNSLQLMPPLALLAAIMSLGQIQVVSEPTNTHNVWVANYLGLPVEDLTKTTLAYMVAVAVAGLIMGSVMFF